jgi:hypothetical protein
MKKILLITFYFSLFTFNYSLSFGQSWLWGVGGVVFASNSYYTNIAVDNQGNVYQIGTYEDSIILGTLKLTTPSEGVPYLVKYNSNGILQWATQPLNIRKGNATGISVATDSNGNIFETGFFSSTQLVFGSDTLKNGGIFIAKYNQNGNVLWAKQSTGDILNGEIISIATDILGNSYVTGYFQDTITFGSITLISSNSNIFTSIFITKYDPNGNVLWAKQSTGKGNIIKSQSISTNHNVSGGFEYITGYFNGKISFGTYALTGDSSTGTSYVFLVKYDASGNVLWAKQSAASNGTNDYALGNAVISDTLGNSYIGGSFIDTIEFDSDTLISPISTPFLVKYNSSGKIIWIKKSEKTGWINWWSSSLSSDKHNHIYYSGVSGGNNGKIDTLQWGSSIITSSYSDNYPATFILELDTSGNFLCGSILNRGTSTPLSNEPQASSVASDSTGIYTYLACIASSDSFICGHDTLTDPYHQSDGLNYIARWNACNEREAINELKTNSEELSIYPNPNNGKFIIQSPLPPKGGTTVEVYNVLGERVYAGMPLNPQTGTLRQCAYPIDLSSSPSGVYLYRVVNEDGGLAGSGKFVIER